MPNRFQYVLLALVLLILVQPLVAEGTVPGYASKILSLFVIVSAYRILKPHRGLLWTTAVLLIIAAVTGAADQFGGGQLVYAGAAAAIVAALTILAFVISRQALREHQVTKDTLLGAVVVYLLIGITATYLYEAMEILAPGAFTNLQGLTSAQIFAELNYFSLVTLTTLGYGDIVPIGSAARVLATLEAIMGQFFVAAVVGLLVSRSGAQRPSAQGSGAGAAHLPNTPRG